MIETYDLAVIGAGPAGIEAALMASQLGVQTVVIDSYPQPGGQYYKPLPAQFSTAHENKIELEGRLLTNRLDDLSITRIYNTLTWGLFDGENEQEWLVGLFGEQAPKYIRAKNLVLANGAYDTPVAFPGWTLPGVITCGAALTLLKTQRVAPTGRALVTGTGPLLLSAAAHLIEAGVKVVGVCEASRIFPRGLSLGMSLLGQGQRLSEGLKYMGAMLRTKTPYKIGWTILEVRGSDRVAEAIIGKVDRYGAPVPGTERSLPVDLVVSGYNLTPNTGLVRMIGCKLDFNNKLGGWIPNRDDRMQSSVPGVYIVGDGAGIGGVEQARLEGKIAGVAVAAAAGQVSPDKAAELLQTIQPKLEHQQQFGKLLGELFTPNPGLISLSRDDTIVCRCEEITLGEVKAAVASGARTIGEVKMITRTGMGNCQGRMCEHSVSGAIAQALSSDKSVSPESVGYYSIRPPLHPLPVGFLAEAGIEDEEGDQ
jgi:NADPH-dependent 2,4-dienoyl-CoA reductase/sulfur reductase-like enzyme